MRAEAHFLRTYGDVRQTLWEEVLIALYMRLGTCLVHHLKDLPAYLEAWSRWRERVGSTMP